MIKRIFLAVSTVLLVYLASEFLPEYWFHHQYYATMLQSWQNTKIVLMGIIFALIPAGYLLFAKHKHRWGVVGTLFAGLFLFTLSYVSIKADLFGGALKLFINVAFLLGIALYMLVAFVALGTWIKERFLKLSTDKIFDVILNLGIGLAAFLVINYLLIIAHVFYPVVTWILFIGAGVMMWMMKDKLQEIWQIIQETLGSLTPHKVHPIRYAVMSLPLLAYSIFSLNAGDATLWTWLLFLVGGGAVVSYLSHGARTNHWGGEELLSMAGITRLFTFVLLVLSVWYLFNGFTLALIPYPTAWDANHAYMFFPKMRAYNNGYYWNEIGMAAGAQLWYAFIAYWFSLFTPFTNFLGLSPDTIAIEMNFWSGFLVLIFGLGLVAEVVAYLQEKNKDHAKPHHQLVFLMGRFLLLQWLMSGMGAFLVFIDNKTDLGVLALIILAVYSGFVFLRQVDHEHGMILPTHHHHRAARYLIGLSGFFYAIAALAKPTAMFDVVNFGLFAWWTWFGWLGAVGGALLIAGLLAGMEFTGIKSYLSSQAGSWMGALGALGVGADVARGVMKKTKIFAQYFLIWIGVFLATFLVIKLPYRVADSIAYDRGGSVSDFVKNLFLAQTAPEHAAFVAKTSTGLPAGRQLPLLAQASGEEVVQPTASGEVAPVAQPARVLGPTMCTLAGQGVGSVDELYEKLQKGGDSGYSEDVGRYVGYGWKGNASDIRRNVFPFMGGLLGMFWSEGCHGFSPLKGSASDGKILCETETQWKSYDVAQMNAVLTQLAPAGEAATMLSDLIALVSADTRTMAEKSAAYAPDIQAIDAYMQDNTVKVVRSTQGTEQIYFPYKYLNIFNISFNWSLQNLSSYYTDIGLVWLVLFIFTIVGLIYGLVSRKQALTGISMVTLFGWLLWWFIGGGILWYAIGIVVWSILAFLFYMYYMLSDDETPATMTLAYIFIFAVAVFGAIQMVLNLVRISSQGGGGAFIWYKTNFGVEQNLTETLQSANTPEPGFGQDDVFNMQFPHYREFLKLANERAADEGVFVAGTYARYFIKNQHHVRDDGFLSWLWEMSSDNDTCNTYLRLKDNYIRYMVIDPNIGTVVQGAGNQSLFDRFFARVNNVTNMIEEHGAMTMLASLYQDGYIRYVSSNNLGAKYAFTMPDATFGGLQGDQLTITRARMAVARYFGNGMLDPIVNIAMQRVKDGTFVTDIADILGLEVDDAKLMAIVQKGQPTVQDIATLTQDERKALQQFIAIRQQATAGDDALRQQLAGLIANNAGGGNQVIVLELVE